MYGWPSDDIDGAWWDEWEQRVAADEATPDYDELMAREDSGMLDDYNE